MKTDLKDKLAAEFESANFFEELPEEIHGFKLKKIFTDDGDRFDYFTFDDEKNHRALTAYFHAETMEYKVRAKIGLSEFCLTKFFSADFEHFKKILAEELEPSIKNLVTPINAATDILIKAKNFSAWKYGEQLPKNIFGFELFISPAAPVKFTNGSYAIINYSNFTQESDLTVSYNVYGENFSGETRINGVPHVSYLFDAENLDELESKLEKNLVAELQNLNEH